MAAIQLGRSIKPCYERMITQSFNNEEQSTVTLCVKYDKYVSLYMKRQMHGCSLNNISINLSILIILCL